MKKILAVLMSLLLVCGTAIAEDAVTSATLRIEALPEVEAQENGILVAYFSPDDTTRAAAYAAAAALSAELFEIEAAEPYTEEDLDYFNSQARAMAEMRDKMIRPAVAALPENLDRYETVFLMYPIWGGQAPMIISTFLEGVDLSGKTVIPLCTSNTSEIGSSAVKLKPLADASVTWKAGTRIPKGSTAEEIGAVALELLQE